MLRKFIAECFGTFVLVFFGCGVAVISGGNLVSTSLAFGLALMCMVFAIGGISGCHINPAVSIAMLVKKEISVKQFFIYLGGQLLGAAIGTYFVAMLTNEFKNVGANQISDFVYAAHDGKAVAMLVAFLVEFILTLIFVYVILAVTSKKENAKIAGFVIGLALTLVHLLGIAITGTSVNPARSIMPALFARGDALKEVWIFILAPLAGGALAALLFGYMNKEEKTEEIVN